MSRPLLIFDAQFLAYRSWFAMSRLKDEERALAATYGFFESIKLIKRRYETDHSVLCFDAKHLIRRDMFPGYKKRDLSNEEQQEREVFHKQVDAIRTDYLGRIGFNNVFYQEGYEADDIIAHIANRVKNRMVYIVTNDDDLLQCISSNVRWYSPARNKTWTKRTFTEQYSIPPKEWVKVKAISGCSSDKIPGVPGVADKTALKYLTGRLKPESKAYQKIVSDEGRQVYQRNLKLVRLPLKGVEVPRLKSDKISRKGWKEVCDEIMAIPGEAPTYAS